MKKTSIKLSEVTTYKFGGYCHNFFEINSLKQLENIGFDNRDKDLLILGKGSNIVFSDAGYEGTIIKPDFNFIELNIEKNILSLGASTYLPDIARFSKDNSISSLEWLIGIPGSVGGAVQMNAGAYGYEFSDHIESVTFYNFETNKIESESKDFFEFSYRTAKNLDSKMVVSVDFIVEKGDPIVIQSQISEYLNRRKKTQPPAIYNAGSVFKNPKNGSAGYLIEKAGLKGFSIGGVEVSQKHANFFVAQKDSKAQSLYELVKYVKGIVRQKFDISLTEEIIFAGKFN